MRLKVRRPHDAQRQIYDCAARFVVACCGRRFGKSEFIPTKRLRNIIKGQPGAYFAPNYKMLQQYYRNTRELLRPWIAHESKVEHRFEFITGASLTMWSLEAFDSVRGQKYAYADIDEAAMVANLEEAWNAVIRPTLTDLEGEAAFWSTPKGLNYFHTIFARGQDDAFADWRSFQFPTSANPYIKQSEIDAARQELPEDVFRQEYLAEFLAGEGSVFRNITANLTQEETTPDAHRGHALVAGVDWGQVNDFTAVSVVCETCRREVELDRFNRIEWDFQRNRLLGLLDKWDVSFAVCEENSIGSPNLEALGRMTRRRLAGFQTTAQTKPPLIQSLALALEQEEMKWLDVPVATRELEAYEATRNAVTNRIQYSAPAGFHDDTVIARALARHAIEERRRGAWQFKQFRF